jgi:hypothetical protein
MLKVGQIRRDGPELAPTFEETLFNVIDAARELHDLRSGRDEMMVGPTPARRGGVTAGNLEKVLNDTFNQRPELLSKDVVRIVDTHSPEHALMFHRARAAGVPVERSFPDSTYTFDYATELTRRTDLGIGLTPDFVAKCFAEGVVQTETLKTLDRQQQIPTHDRIKYFRTLADAFTMADAERLHSAMLDRAIVGDGNNVRTVINDVLSKGGLGPLATSWSDIANFHKKRAEAQEAKLENVKQDMCRRWGGKTLPFGQNSPH